MPKPKYDYRHGDHNVICDRSGFKVKASETRREWTNSVVRDEDFEQRHPQDLVKGLTDRQFVRDPRPGAVDITLDSETTLTAEATGTVLSVASTMQFEVGDPVYIQLDNNETHLSVIDSYVDDTSVTLTTSLPSKASSGNAVRVITSTVTL